MSEDLIKAVAAAIDVHFSGADRAYDEHVACARAALAAIEASGTHCVVPAEATDDMVNATQEGDSCGSMYAAMLSARPKVVS